MKKVTILTIMVILAVSLVFPAFPATLAGNTSIQQQKSSVDEKLNSVQNQKNQVQKEVNRTKTNIREIENIQQAENLKYRQALETLKAINREIGIINKAFDDAKKDYEIQMTTFKKRLLAMYENSEDSIFDLIVKSDGMTDFFERVELMQLISRRDKEILEDLKQSKADLDYKRQMKYSLKSKQEKATQDKKQHLTVLISTRAEYYEKLRENKDMLDRLDRLEDQLIEQSKELEKRIKGLQNNRKYTGGTMRWPIPGQYSVSSPYGMRVHPILRRYKMHTGVDIHANSGDTIIAANTGTVILSSRNGGYGLCVVIDHGGGISTLYAHCSKLLVRAGQEVKAGQTIAKAGSTGLSTGPHLHFEVRVNGKTVNPMKGYISR